MPGKYPTAPDTKRPFRLWNAKAKTQVRWRYYASQFRAHIGALIEAGAYLEVGNTIEVFNVQKGRLLGQYTRRVDGVQFDPIPERVIPKRKEK